MEKFTVNKFNAADINKVADAMANDLNNGTFTLRETTDQIAKQFGFDYAIWVMEKAQQLMGLGGK